MGTTLESAAAVVPLSFSLREHGENSYRGEGGDLARESREIVEGWE